MLRGDPEFVDVEAISPITNPKFGKTKRPILDVLAKDVTGKLANIEMQSVVRDQFRGRMVYYNSVTFASQLKLGDGYHQLKSTISISVLGETLFPNVPDFHLDFRLRSECGREKLTDLIQLHTLELPKYIKPEDNIKVVDPLEKWMYFFAFAKSMSSSQIAARLDDPIFLEAAEVLQMIAKDPNERLLYEMSLKHERDIESLVAQGRQEGLEEGREERNGERPRAGHVGWQNSDTAGDSW